jgi:hypothetical protein
LRELILNRKEVVVLPWCANNLFNAATCFAITILRAVRTWTIGSNARYEDDIHILSNGSDLTRPNRTLEPNHLEANAQVPSVIYFDEVIRDRANKILLVLDKLSLLKANPIGKSAEQRLARLIERYGLRDAQGFATGVAAITPVEEGKEKGQMDWTWLDGMGSSQEEESGMDQPEFMDDLFRMDLGLWDNLLDPRILR